jgi:hypothetical protein
MHERNICASGTTTLADPGPERRKLRSMTSSMPPWLAAALLGAEAMLMQGCGQGLFDRARALEDAAATYDGEVEAVILPPTDDAAAPVDDGPKPPVDDVAKPNDDLPKPPDDGSNPSVCDGGNPADNVQTFDSNGGRLTLGSATLTIAPGTFKDGTSVQICIRQIESIAHTGAYGPVFEISVPVPHLFRQTPLLTLQVPDLSPNQSFLPYIALGTLDPSKSLADQQWVPASESSLSSDQKSVSGSVTDFENLTVVQFGVIVGCPSAMMCPPHQACNSSACQQCPTLTNCP